MLRYGFTIFNQNSMNPNYIPYFDKPTTLKEKLLIKELKLKGFDSIDIEIPNPAIETHGRYFVGFDKYSHTSKRELDSLQHFLHNLSIQLYSEVIEDSILYVTENIYIKMYYDIKRGYRYESMYDINYEISKDSLEKLCGFRVTKLCKNEYKRVPVINL